MLHRLAAVNPRIRILDLSRNFGKEAALSAGLAHAAGDAVICMDADLQHPPALIPTFLDHWEHGAEVVVTVREDTHEPSLVRRAGSAIFYWLLTRMSDVEVVGKSTDYRLLDRRVVEAFLQLADHDRLVRGLVEGAPGPVRWVIIAAEALTGIDTTALEDLVELDDHLDRQGISLVFAEMKGPIKDRLVRFGVGSRFGPEHFFPTVNSAVKAYRKTYDV